MKKVCLLLSALFVCMIASAQVTFNCKGGFGISTMAGSDAEGSKIKTGWKIGVGLEKPLSANWLLMPTLEFKQKGAQYKDVSGSNNYEDKVSLQYIQLPIMVAYRTRLNDNLNLTLKAGPYFAYGISGKDKYADDYNGSHYEEEDDFFGSDTNRFDCGIGIGVDFEYHRFVVGLEGEYGFINLYKDDDDHIKVYNVGAYVTVGYKF